jgi:hypothetical protein
MRTHLTKTNGAMTALMAGAIMLFWSTISLAGTPTLGPDCGASGVAIAGSDSAGKVTLGAPAVGASMASTCTLSFSVSYPTAPACSATNETNGGGFAVAIGARTTTTTIEIDAINPWVVGDVISYSCLDY